MERFDQRHLASLEQRHQRRRVERAFDGVDGDIALGAHVHNRPLAVAAPRQRLGAQLDRLDEHDPRREKRAVLDGLVVLDYLLQKPARAPDVGIAVIGQDGLAARRR